MANKTELIAFEIGDNVAEKLGMTVVDVQFKKEDGKQYLRIFIDKDGGVGIDDCEAFSREFGDEIDKKDPIETEYILEVSSPGVDRKLKTDREFSHYTGRTVDVKLYKAQDGQKEFSGILKDCNAGVATVECADRLFEINTKDAAYIKLHFEF